MSVRSLRRLLALGVLGGVLAVLALPTAAGAHVEAEAENAGGVTTVTFSFHHGCDGNPTTSLRVQLPAGTTEVTPEDPAGWTSTISATELAWTGGSVPDSEDAAFVATMKLTEPEGTTVFLPTVQGCTGDTEEACIARSDDPEAANAAPRIVAGAAALETEGHDDTGGAKSDHDDDAATSSIPAATTNGPATSAPASSNSGSGSGREAAAPATEPASSTTSSSTPLVIGAIAAVVVIGALVAFVVSRRGSNPSA